MGSQPPITVSNEAESRPAPACHGCGARDGRLIFVKQGYRLVECRRCGLAYIDNPPTQAELRAIYSAGADYHSELMRPGSPEFERMGRVGGHHLRRLLALKQSGRLLDVGCSTGLFLDRARSHGFEAEGIEFSPDSAAFARDHFGLPVTVGTIHGLSGEEGGYDIVTMFDVLEHVTDPAGDVAAVRKLLKPGGLFLISMPNIDGLFPRVSRPFARLIDYWPHPEPPYHLTQFSVGTLSSLLRKGGFRIGRVFHEKMPLAYSFGKLATLRSSPRMAAYATIFAPFAWVGPLLRMGDAFYLAAWRED